MREIYHQGCWYRDLPICLGYTYMLEKTLHLVILKLCFHLNLIFPLPNRDHHLCDSFIMKLASPLQSNPYPLKRYSSFARRTKIFLDIFHFLFLFINESQMWTNRLYYSFQDSFQIIHSPKRAVVTSQWQTRNFEVPL
jgi:hypothetical protein